MEKEELIRKYNLNLDKLEQEQLKLSKLLRIKDSLDINSIKNIGAVENILVRGKIISAVIVCDENYELKEQEYFLDKLRFPYLPEFKAYRELPAALSAFSKIKEEPDIILIKSEGINHARLGMASQFSLSTGIPSIGVTDNLFKGNTIKARYILMNNKKSGMVFLSKKESRPLYVCPGNLISINSSYDVIRKMIIPPHKFPEPMVLAHKYAKTIKKELKL